MQFILKMNGKLATVEIIFIILPNKYLWKNLKGHLNLYLKGLASKVLKKID